MAPTKNVSDAPQKVVKKRLYKAKPMKPPLKTPKCITVKIAKIDSKPPRITRKVSSLQKIELANEVALKQLAKPLDTIITPPSPLVKVTLAKETVDSPECSKTKPTPRKRKHSPILPPDTSSDDNPLSNVVVKLEREEVACKPKRKRKQPLKPSEAQALKPTEAQPLKPSKAQPLKPSKAQPLKPSKAQPLKTSEADDLNTPSISLLKEISVSKVTSSESELAPTLIKPVSAARSRKKPGKKREQKVIPDYVSDKPVNVEPVVPEEVPKTPVKRVRKKTPKKPQIEMKGSTTKVLEEKTTIKKKRPPKEKTGLHKELNEKLNSKVAKTKKGKGITAKEIKIASALLENNLKKDAALVQTRSESVNSSTSNLSWTKDISTASSFSSSTTTCVTVTSNDFVMFDKKLPFVQVENVQVENTSFDKLYTKVIHKNKERTILESSSSASDSKRSKPSSPSVYDESVGNPDLNLSTSSLTGESSRPQSSLMNAELMYLEMDGLTRSLSLFYTEIGKWGLVESDDDDCDIFSIISEATKEISNFNSILDDDNFQANKKANPENRSLETIREVVVRDRNNYESSRESAEDSRPSRMAREDAAQSSDDEYSDPEVGFSPTSSNKSSVREKFPINVPDNFAIPTTLLKNLSAPVARSSHSSETFTSDNYNYVSFEDKVCEDEDALSLFAESISGMESSRLSSVASVQEPYIQKPPPYVPEPINPLLLERYTYRPTRISDEPQKDENVPLKTIQPDMVEKQNADSSSIGKEPSVIETAVSLTQQANQICSQGPESSGTVVDAPTQPRRVFPLYQPVTAVRSLLYKQYCFFYLATQCKKSHCRFPHSDIGRNILKSRLAALNEDNLIEEYLLTCKFTNLRRKYCLMFMQECRRRAATRLLMEMAIDLGLGVVEREDHTLTVIALEITLLHLNEINFDACNDLLTFTYNGTTMCDALLLCMANSQNFAQFKAAFVKLANFMMQIKRPVDINIVSSILERVCILPCEENLVKGMLCLMKNTDPRIFDNSMTNSFEVQLSNVESDVLVPYWTAKKEAIEARLTDVTLNPPGSGTISCEPRHTSPDTTNFDNLKKAQMAQPTTFKRTINTEAISHLFKSPLNPAPKQRYSTQRPWYRGMNYNMRGGPRTRMPSGRRVHGTPANY